VGDAAKAQGKALGASEVVELFTMRPNLLPRGVQGVALVPGTVGSAALHPDERTLLTDLVGSRAAQFAAGRACARCAMAQLGAAGPVLTGGDGAPIWPEGVRGSISHKEGLAVAVVGRSDSVAGLGVDLEDAGALPRPVWEHVLTPGEQSRLTATDDEAATTARLVFSAKEAYYEWFRSAGRDEPVGFQDVEVDPVGGRLHYRPRAGTGFPTPHGAFARGRDWLVTVAWSVPTP
jgi:4'-phosphopantetheinyl transferase EntD